MALRPTMFAQSRDAFLGMVHSVLSFQSKTYKFADARLDPDQVGNTISSGDVTNDWAFKVITKALTFIPSRPVLDIVLDLAQGDTGKGKITYNYLVKGDYTHVLRGSSGANAGHQIVVNDVKYTTHIVPCGVFHNTPSIIGSGCVVHPKSFLKEIEGLEKAGFNASSLTKISHAAHIVTDAHLEEEAAEAKIGTTKQGIGPAYRDKASRIGIRAESIPELKPYLIDVYQELYPSSIILGEGAQGFYLDLDLGSYPYVTSSSTTHAGFLANGLPASSVRQVIGTIKAYTTYVGALAFQPEGDIFNKIAELGHEYGSTTGRRRQVNFLDLNALTKAANMTGIHTLVVSKMDILKQLNCWKLIENNEVIDLQFEDAFKAKISQLLPNIEIRWSYSPKEI